MVVFKGLILSHDDFVDASYESHLRFFRYEGLQYWYSRCSFAPTRMPKRSAVLFESKLLPCVTESKYHTQWRVTVSFFKSQTVESFWFTKFHVGICMDNQAGFESLIFMQRFQTALPDSPEVALVSYYFHESACCNLKDMHDRHQKWFSLLCTWAGIIYALMSCWSSWRLEVDVHMMTLWRIRKEQKLGRLMR